MGLLLARGGRLLGSFVAGARRMAPRDALVGPSGTSARHWAPQTAPLPCEQPLEVVRQRHPRPFSPHVLETAQAEPPETHGAFDDPENRVNGLFALRGELAARFGPESIFHLLFGARYRPGRRRVRPLFELLDGAPVGLALGCRVDSRTGGVAVRLLRLGHRSGAVIPLSTSTAPTPSITGLTAASVGANCSLSLGALVTLTPTRRRLSISTAACAL